MGNVAEVMLGKAISSVMFDSLASVMATFSQYVQQNNHSRFLSGAVVLRIFNFLVMIGNLAAHFLKESQFQFQVFTNFLAIQILHLKH